MASNVDLASPKHRPRFILALPSLINLKKKRLASLHSTPTRLQTTQYVTRSSPSSNTVIDMDMLKTILLIALGLLVVLTAMALLIFL